MSRAFLSHPLLAGEGRDLAGESPSIYVPQRTYLDRLLIPEWAGTARLPKLAVDRGRDRCGQDVMDSFPPLLLLLLLRKPPERGYYPRPRRERRGSR